VRGFQFRFFERNRRRPIRFVKKPNGLLRQSSSSAIGGSGGSVITFAIIFLEVEARYPDQNLSTSFRKSPSHHV
jgi:hypothetical protein